MNAKPEASVRDVSPQAESLVRVLGQSEHVKSMVAECAEELSSVNSVLKQEVAEQEHLSGIEEVLEMSEAVEGKVQEAADRLAVVNHELEAEVEARQVLEQRLATAVEDEEAARQAAFHDPLTGLPNRALFDDRLEHGLAQARRHGWTLAVMFMDLDGFKQINDVHGHDVGDAVLQTIAERLKASTRRDDTVSRHGGDEFLYLLMEVGDADDVGVIAEKISHAVQAPCQLSVGEIVIKTSIGISIFPRDGDTGFDLVKSADKAMYESKRNRSVYAFAR